jgi:hypothetical protein
MPDITTLALSFVDPDEYCASVAKCTRLIKRMNEANAIATKIQSLNHQELAMLEILIDKLNRA